ncbi:MAG: hypothetical protein ACRCV0_03925 [Brevinema sp.]
MCKTYSWIFILISFCGADKNIFYNPWEGEGSLTPQINNFGINYEKLFVVDIALNDIPIILVINSQGHYLWKPYAKHHKTFEKFDLLYDLNLFKKKILYYIIFFYNQYNVWLLNLVRQKLGTQNPVFVQTRDESDQKQLSDLENIAPLNNCFCVVTNK